MALALPVIRWHRLPLLALLLLGMILFTPTAAHAQTPGSGGGSLSSFSLFPSYLGVGGSFIREDIDKEIEYEDTGALSVKLGFEIFKFFHLELEFTYFPEFEGDGNVAVGTTKEDRDMFSYMAVAKFPLALSFTLVKPHLIFGMGAFQSFREFRENLQGGGSQKRDDVEAGLILKYGVNIDLHLIENITIGTEACFYQLIGDSDRSDDDVKFFMFTLYVAYRF